MDCVIFDLGGVVVRWDPVRIVEDFYDDAQLRETALREIFRHGDWIEMDRGMLHEADALRGFHRRMGRPLDEMQALMEAIKESLQPIPQTIDLLHELREFGVPVYGLSNISEPMAAHLRARHEFWTLFSDIVVSGRIKLVKPDPAIFHYVAQRFELTPSRTMFIDDMPANVDSARRLGFIAHQFTDPLRCRSEVLTRLRRS